MHRLRTIAGVLAASLLFTPAAFAARPANHDARVSVATLPGIGLASFQNATLPGSIADDRGVDLGGIGSDLYPAGRSGEYWMVTDRGPNGQIKVDGKNRRTFPVPAFDPTIVRVRVDGSRMRVLRSVPILTRSGEPVTGLSNLEDYDEKPYNYNATTALAYNPDGLDTEGLIVARDGSFWLSEEYSPSVVHVARDGRVLARFVPKGLGLEDTGYPVHETLPEILLTRQGNRGFESMALAPDGRTLYTMNQSPLENPDEDTGESSRQLRILAIDARDGRPKAEYVYRMEDVTTFDPGADGDQNEMKVSGLVALGRDRLLVDERTDDVAKLYVADLHHATNILGSTWDDQDTAPSLEQLASPSDGDLTAVRKSPALDLSTIEGVPGKVEGVAMPNPWTIAVASDNDFGMTDGPEAFDENGRLVDSGVESKLVTIRLPRPLR
ncbi:esterase-like activity of phytase family protein [Flindersiella endophytica]